MASDSITVAPRGRPKGDKRARTRARLIQATIELIREKGYDQITLAEVAKRAGMTTGAIYGNFKNRDALFMAVGNDRGAPIIPKVRPGMTFAEVMRATAEAVIAAIPQRRESARGALGYHVYTLTHKEMRARVIATTAKRYRAVAEAFLTMFPESDLPMPAATLVRVLHVMTDGLILQRILTPELIPDEVIYAAFAALAGERTAAQAASTPA